MSHTYALQQKQRLLGIPKCALVQQCEKGTVEFSFRYARKSGRAAIGSLCCITRTELYVVYFQMEQRGL